ncbi:hypothetical protein T265_04568 [Opisthorchis viverrini]|uniref:Uncharacterized protein n=1 Tax=Opisthorchis viverrini TaxID=6198 RepID=A0A075AGC9_OPIVI|nr:hypothetical protein T265_04568 [Opisthorchis viverrini]KER28614.1 hypothetical protein T265_04568 [Opisthorchis viverrini]
MAVYLIVLRRDSGHTLLICSSSVFVLPEREKPGNFCCTVSPPVDGTVPLDKSAAPLLVVPNPDEVSLGILRLEATEPPHSTAERPEVHSRKKLGSVGDTTHNSPSYQYEAAALYFSWNWELVVGETAYEKPGTVWLLICSLSLVVGSQRFITIVSAGVPVEYNHGHRDIELDIDIQFVSDY